MASLISIILERHSPISTCSAYSPDGVAGEFYPGYSYPLIMPEYGTARARNSGRKVQRQRTESHLLLRGLLFCGGWRVKRVIDGRSSGAMLRRLQQAPPRCSLLVKFGRGRGKRLDYSPPTSTNRVRFPAGSLLDFRNWESCWTMPLVGGFSRGFLASAASSFRRCFTLIGSQDLDSYDGNTARLARRSDEPLGVRVSVARIAPSLLDLGRGVPRGSIPLLMLHKLALAPTLLFLHKLFVDAVLVASRRDWRTKWAEMMTKLGENEIRSGKKTGESEGAKKVGEILMRLWVRRGDKVDSHGRVEYVFAFDSAVLTYLLKTQQGYSRSTDNTSPLCITDCPTLKTSNSGVSRRCRHVALSSPNDGRSPFLQSSSDLRYVCICLESFLCLPYFPVTLPDVEGNADLSECRRQTPPHTQGAATLSHTRRARAKSFLFCEENPPTPFAEKFVPILSVPSIREVVGSIATGYRLFTILLPFESEKRGSNKFDTATRSECPHRPYARGLRAGVPWSRRVACIVFSFLYVLGPKLFIHWLLGPRWCRLDCSPTTKANRVRFPAGSHPIVSYVAAGWRVFSGISRFCRPCIPTLLRTQHASPSSVLETLEMLRAAQISSLAHFIGCCNVELVALDTSKAHLTVYYWRMIRPGRVVVAEFPYLNTSRKYRVKWCLETPSQHTVLRTITPRHIQYRPNKARRCFWCKIVIGCVLLLIVQCIRLGLPCAVFRWPGRLSAGWVLNADWQCGVNVERCRLSYRCSDIYIYDGGDQRHGPSVWKSSSSPRRWPQLLVRATPAIYGDNSPHNSPLVLCPPRRAVRVLTRDVTYNSVLAPLMPGFHHRGSKLDPRSDLRPTQKTVQLNWGSRLNSFRTTEIGGSKSRSEISSHRRQIHIYSEKYAYFHDIKYYEPIAKFVSYLISISHFGTKIDESEIKNHEISLTQHVYIGTKIKLEPVSELGSFDLGSGKMLVQPGWTDVGLAPTGHLATRAWHLNLLGYRRSITTGIVLCVLGEDATPKRGGDFSWRHCSSLTLGQHGVIEKPKLCAKRRKECPLNRINLSIENFKYDPFEASTNVPDSLVPLTAHTLEDRHTGGGISLKKNFSRASGNLEVTMNGLHALYLSSEQVNNMLRASRPRLPAPFFSASEAEKRGSDKGDTTTHIKCALAAKRKALYWRAVFSSHCVYLWNFQR
ncbi:hypothetical protein PR048_023234 [Dryococelus australis]|uniref:Uncharacterized protein n=1 Tax=Dryococelus australis TaxID=614101 RepID=A0ABQ9GTL1_9NEOP|nr:hypothetical protein PR048_023234 [Dryococelus australis]